MVSPGMGTKLKPAWMPFVTKQWNAYGGESADWNSSNANN